MKKRFFIILSDSVIPHVINLYKNIFKSLNTFIKITANNDRNPPPPESHVDDHCNKTVDIYVDIQSPPLTRFNRFRPLTCWYRFKSIRGVPKEWVLRLTFKKFKVGTLVNSTHCDDGYLQVSWL